MANTLVFLHGFLLDSTMWTHFKNDFDSTNCVFLDLPGHGANKSTTLSDESIEVYATWVYEQLTELGVQNYDLVGHSLGGYIGLELIQIDQRLDKLILFHSNTWADNEERRKNRDRVGPVVRKSLRVFLNESIPLLFHKPEKHQQQIYEIIEKASTMSPDSIIHAAQAMKNRNDLSHVIAENKDRCFILQGDHDNLIPTAESKLAWKGHDRHYSLLENCGHMSHIEQPELFVRTIRSIIE
jgi:pimeloyl-ACP methyl ester carboxylesterase